LSLQVR
jgi:hypothetical protein